MFISVNEIGHDLFGAVSVGGSGAPTGPSMQGRLCRAGARKLGTQAWQS